MENKKTSFTAKTYLLKLTMLAIAILATQLVFALVVLFNSLETLGQINNENLTLFIILVPTTTVVMIGASFFIFNLKLKEIHNSNDLTSKLSLYTSALIIRFALLEGSSFIATIAFMLTGGIYFLATPVLITCLMLSYFPNKRRVLLHLKLNLKEEDYFHQQ